MNFDPEQHLAPKSELAKEGVSLLMHAWPFFENALSEALVSAIDADPTVARIVIGNMEAKTKLERFRYICLHHESADDAKAIAQIIKKHRLASEIRNTVAHCPFIGVMKDDPTRLIFLKGRFVVGSRNVEISAIRMRQIHAATKFAIETAASFGRILARVYGVELPADILGERSPNPSP